MKWNLLAAQDLSILEEFQAKYSGTEYELKKHLLSEPFIGIPKTAKIIFLALNPGYHRDDDAVHLKTSFRKLVENNINFTETEFPYYYLHDDINLTSDPGFRWCRRIFKELLNKVPVRSLAKNICCIQFHGYHSARYKSFGKMLLPSQEKTFEMIRNAMKN